MVPGAPLRTIPAQTADGRLILRLLNEALSRLETDRSGARACMEQVRALAAGEGPGPAARGGLAPWQVRRVSARIERDLALPLRLSDVAAEARLSPSYFSRAFRISFGSPFSDYLIARRIEQAQVLLLTSDEPISRIALACGLADQSHLTRLFSRRIGAPPSVWRRQHRQGLQGSPATPQPSL
ncbi:helix-turn-helix transcriptional regulator [Caulobacter sp. KR2-114]|uniref:helix-turn-helix transcriptional regulator n=1 Tax=Caulobacter sp. KR2-114 TaxID=3400912 RepID=UPI003C098305